jgi:UDP-2,3-diacylglucosamine hydrolase
MICFISDLHLCDEKPELTTLFDYFMREIAPNYKHLYILGDFFEAWVGDDFDSETNSKVKDWLHAYTAKGHQLSIMHGNRDFLIGQSFCNEVNAQLLNDIHDLDINYLDPKIHSENTVTKIRLMHGDQLCTEDKAYQSFRQMVRSSDWQNDFLSKSLAERIAIAEYMRSQSQKNYDDSSKANDAENIMDVYQDTVNQHWQEVPLLLHGHTHRPAKHAIAHYRRYVLSDWRDYGNFAEIDNKDKVNSWNFWTNGVKKKVF